MAGEPFRYRYFTKSRTVSWPGPPCCMMQFMSKHAFQRMSVIFTEGGIFRINRHVHHTLFRAISQMPFFRDDMDSRFYHNIQRGERHHSFGLVVSLIQAEIEPFTVSGEFLLRI